MLRAHNAPVALGLLRDEGITGLLLRDVLNAGASFGLRTKPEPKRLCADGPLVPELEEAYVLFLTQIWERCVTGQASNFSKIAVRLVSGYRQLFARSVPGVGYPLHSGYTTDAVTAAYDTFVSPAKFSADKGRGFKTKAAALAFFAFLSGLKDGELVCNESARNSAQALRVLDQLSVVLGAKFDVPVSTTFPMKTAAPSTARRTLPLPTESVHGVPVAAQPPAIVLPPSLSSSNLSSFNVRAPPAHLVEPRSVVAGPAPACATPSSFSSVSTASSTSFTHKRAPAEEELAVEVLVTFSKRVCLNVE